MIDGVRIKKLKVHRDARGRLMEILRADDELFQKFGQVYLTTVYPGVVKGWHCHTSQTDNFCCVSGAIRLVIYDGREGSRTKGGLQKVSAGSDEPVLVQVPPGVYHGFKCLGGQEALVINIPTRTYDYEHPDELRLDRHTKDIPYDWDNDDG